MNGNGQKKVLGLKIDGNPVNASLRPFWKSSAKKLRAQIMSSLLSILTLTLLAAPAFALTPGMVADNGSSSVTVFDADTNAVLGTVPIPAGEATGDVLITPDRRLGFVTNFDSKVFVIDLTTTPPSLAGGTNPIPISNFGEDLALSPDGKFLLVCDGSAVQPISVIDIAARVEIGIFDTGSDNNSIDVCSDGSVLVTSASGGVRRLTINGSGVLTDTGETLAVSGPQNVYCAPGARSGLVISYWDNLVQSFMIPGLAAVDARALSGTEGGISGALNQAGDRVYIRSNGGGGGEIKVATIQAGGFVDAFSYNSATGALGASPLLSIPIAPANTFYGMDQMALSGNRLYVSQPEALNVYDAGTGNLLASITDVNIVSPSGVTFQAAGDICAGAPPANAIVGTLRSDRIVGTEGDDIIFGLGGSDVIIGLGGNDTICGGAGQDILFGGAGDDRISGGPGDDFLSGDGGDDTLRGGGGNDILVGSAGHDLLMGEAGNDYLNAMDGVSKNDEMNGGIGTDKCHGDAGDGRRSCP